MDTDKKHPQSPAHASIANPERPRTPACAAVPAVKRAAPVFIKKIGC